MKIFADFAANPERTRYRTQYAGLEKKVQARNMCIENAKKQNVNVRIHYFLTKNVRVFCARFNVIVRLDMSAEASQPESHQQEEI